MSSRLDDRRYHEARAEAELQLADAATDPAIACVHRELAILHKRQMMTIVEKPDPLQANVAERRLAGR